MLSMLAGHLSCVWLLRRGIALVAECVNPGTTNHSGGRCWGLSCPRSGRTADALPARNRPVSRSARVMVLANKRIVSQPALVACANAPGGRSTLIHQVGCGSSRIPDCADGPGGAFTKGTQGQSLLPSRRPAHRQWQRCRDSQSYRTTLARPASGALALRFGRPCRRFVTVKGCSRTRTTEVRRNRSDRTKLE
jgi:hypothetical protein